MTGYQASGGLSFHVHHIIVHFVSKLYFSFGDLSKQRIEFNIGKHHKLKLLECQVTFNKLYPKSTITIEADIEEFIRRKFLVQFSILNINSFGLTRVSIWLIGFRPGNQPHCTE